MLTVGVDLAAEPKNTAMALIDWSPGKATVVGLDVGVCDERIVDAAANCVNLAIDCPLGWPVPFVEFISSHQDGKSWCQQALRAWRGGGSWRFGPPMRRCGSRG